MTLSATERTRGTGLLRAVAAASSPRGLRGRARAGGLAGASVLVVQLGVLAADVVLVAVLAASASGSRGGPGATGPAMIA